MEKNAKSQYGKKRLITSPGSGAGGFFFPNLSNVWKKSHMAQMAQLGSTELSAALRVPLNLGPTVWTLSLNRQLWVLIVVRT